MNELARSTRYTSQPNGATSWAGRLVTSAKTSAMLVPFLGAGAFAQTGAGDELAIAAKTQMAGVITLIVAILVVGIGLNVLWFANKNTKKGVSKAG